MSGADAGDEAIAAGDEAIAAVCDALADPECLRILRELDDPLAATEVAERCDIPQTSAYRKLTKLHDVGLLEEGTEVRSSGNHRSTFVRDATGVFIGLDDADSFEVELLAERESPDRRLEQFWSRISEEL